MFTIDPNIKDLRVKEKVVSRLYFSMNSPNIATPELGTEEARCYILFFREGNSYSSYVGLYLPSSDRKIYYAYSGNPLSEGAIQAVTEEATRFAEEMGFLLDELNLSGMSVDERNQWIEGQPIFGFKRKAEERADGQPEESAETTSPELSQPIADQVVSQPTTEAAAPEAPPVKATPAVQPSVPVDPDIWPEPEIPVARKTAATRRGAPSAPPAEEDLFNGQEEVARQAPKPAARAPKPSSRKTAPTGAGTVSRELEALARLLASF